jgi:biotin carboxylase
MQTVKVLKKHRVLLLSTTRSYRGPDFLAAAARLDAEIIQGIDMPRELATEWPGGLALDFKHKDEAIQKIFDFAQSNPLDAILAVDDSGTLLAAMASEKLGFRHNSIAAAEAARNKFRMRQLLQEAKLPSPVCHQYTTADDPARIAQSIEFPCVVKPLNLNGSRGVIRANDGDELLAAIKRTTDLLRSLQGSDRPLPFLIESYIPGIEVALEGLMDNGRLIVLALYDKPDPLEGPYFEETIYITPSRLPTKTQEATKSCALQAAQALGLRNGPVHAELRINDHGPWIVEIAGRSIGGLCSRTLQFGTNISLEELILRQACSIDLNSTEQIEDARGVMMIPIPGSGLLREVQGLNEAEAVEMIEKVEITAHLNYPLQPLPEGDGYLGFIFSRGRTPEQVENALRKAHQKITFKIDPLLPMISI